MIKYRTNAMWQGGRHTKLCFDGVGDDNVIWRWNAIPPM